jgi:hypothetical protein
MKRTFSMSSGSSNPRQAILALAQRCGQGVLSQVRDILQSGKLRNPEGLVALLQQIESTGDPGFRYELYYAWRQVTKPGKAHEIQLGAVNGIGGDVVVFRGDRQKQDKTLQIKYVTGTGKKAFKKNLLAAAAQLGSETGNNELASPHTIRTVEMVLENPNLPEAKLSDQELANRLGEYLGSSPKIQYVDRVRLRINNPHGGHRVTTFSRY